LSFLQKHFFSLKRELKSSKNNLQEYGAPEFDDGGIQFSFAFEHQFSGEEGKVFRKVRDDAKSVFGIIEEKFSFLASHIEFIRKLGFGSADEIMERGLKNGRHFF